MRVADSSAVLAVLLRERSGEEIAPRLAGAAMSVVNVVEVLTRLADAGVAPDERVEALAELITDFRPLSLRQAHAAAALRDATRAHGLSLGDRVCLALARELGWPVITADRAWSGVDVGVTIERIR